jgi:hypothetical protein
VNRFCTIAERNVKQEPTHEEYLKFYTRLIGLGLRSNVLRKGGGGGRGGMFTRTKHASFLTNVNGVSSKF